jgi:hypothetical protein
MMMSVQTQQRPTFNATTVANMVFGAVALVCFLILPYSFYNYSWKGDRWFTSWQGITLYYAGPAAAAVLCTFCLRLKAGPKINLAILVSSSILSLYGAETYLNLRRAHIETQPLWGDDFIKRRSEVQSLAGKEGVKFDFRTKLDVFLNLRRAGVNVVPSPGVQFAIQIDGEEVVTFGGISNKTTVFCNETGERTIYQSDEHGFHNPRGLWNSERVEIIALGDSLTEGGCVPSDKNFVARIRRYHPATSNLGLGGHGPLTMLGLLKETLTVIKPKIAIWFYFEASDAIDLFREQKNQLLRRYLEGDFTQNLFSRQESVDRALMDYTEKELAEELSKGNPGIAKVLLRQSQAKLLDIVKLTTVRTRIGLVRGHDEQSLEHGAVAEDTLGLEMTDKDLKVFREILSQAKKAMIESNGQLYFVYLPAWERYGYPPYARKDRDRVLFTVKSLEIPAIDIHPVFQSHRDPLSLFPFRRFGHYNEAGHRLVAKEVLKAISLDGRNRS